MNYNIDTLYLSLFQSDFNKLQYISKYKNTYSYTQTFKTSTSKTFEFSYTVSIFKINDFSFKVKQFKRGKWRLELIGLYQYEKNGDVKDNQNIIKVLFRSLQSCEITRIDLCMDSHKRSLNRELKTSRLVNFKSTIYHNLYNKNYFSSYLYNKQKKNKLNVKIWRTEYSFKGVLKSKNLNFRLKDINKLEHKCKLFINSLHKKANKINKPS